MKTNLIYLFFFLGLLCACSNEDYDSPLQQAEALQVTVRVGDFVTIGATDTRATDSGNTTTFEEGDRMGIIVLDKDNNILSDNIPYIYSGSAWSFDSNSNEGKTTVNYNNRASTYLAYFPYSKDADGINSIDGLKAKFQPLPDQRSKDAYRASDLLVWSSASENAPLTKLEIKFKHAYSLLSFSLSIKCKINGSETSYASSLVSDVSITLDGDPYSAYKANDGSYRIITVPQNTGVTSGYWFCSYSAKTYNGTVSVSSLAEEYRYVLTPSLNIGDYSLDKAKIGDFYCKSSDGSTGYLIPGDIAELSDDQKSACLGIVMKVGKDNSGDWKDEGSYKQKGTTTDMGTIHGYVLALKDGNGGNTCAWGPTNNTVGTDQSQYVLFCGYTNTQIIKNYVSNDSGKTLQNDFPAAYHASEGYETRESGKYSSPSNSSGWFLPSAGQCWYWYQNRDLLKVSMDKVGGDEWQNYYWSSSEGGDYPASYACYVVFRLGGVYRDGSKSGDRNFRVRSSLAF